MNPEIKQRIRVKPALCVLAYAGTEAKKKHGYFLSCHFNNYRNKISNKAVMTSKNVFLA